MGFLANIRVRIEEWWRNYKKDVAIARERQRMLRLIRDKSYAKEKGRQDAITKGHRARAPPREYNNSLFTLPPAKDSVGTLEPKDAIGIIEPIDSIGKVEDIFKGVNDDK